MIKRDLHLFLRCLLAAVILTAAIAAVGTAAAVVSARGAVEVYKPVKVAVVDGEDSILSRMLIRAVAGSDHIAQLLEVERCDADEAMLALSGGEYAAVIELPQGFVDDILTGKEKRGRITLSAAAAAHSDVVASVASFGELLLAAGQYAVFSGETLMERYETDAVFREAFLAQVNTQLLTEAMAAEREYFALSVTDYADTGLSLEGHYAVSWLAALLLAAAVMFERLYTADRGSSMLLRLKACGVSDGRFLVGKIILPGGYLAVILFCGAWILREWIPVCAEPKAVLCAILSVAVTAFTAAVGMMCLKKGAGALLTLAVFGIFLHGGLVPRQLLDERLRMVGDWLPTGLSRSLLLPVFGGEVSTVAVAVSVCWMIGCTAVLAVHLGALRKKGGAQ